MSAQFNHEHMYTYLKGYATAKHWSDTLAALPFAREKHAGQTRKTGEPYIVHPLTMACHAVALGIDEDPVVATLLLHDVPEDCGVKYDGLPVSPQTRDAVRRLTHVKGEPLEPYYRQIAEDRVATISKIFDSCDNLSTMPGAFSPAKMESYILEKREFVIPLIRHAKDTWPQNHGALFVLKYHILSVVDGLDACLKTDVADVRLRMDKMLADKDSEAAKSAPIRMILETAVEALDTATKND